MAHKQDKNTKNAYLLIVGFLWILKINYLIIKFLVLFKSLFFCSWILSWRYFLRIVAVKILPAGKLSNNNFVFFMPRLNNWFV